MKHLLIFALLLMLTGCKTVATFAPVQVGQLFEPRTAPEKIELFRSQMPVKNFAEIGTVHDCCHHSERMIDRMRHKAAAQGGDALISLELDAQGGATATVIRYQ